MDSASTVDSVPAPTTDTFFSDAQRQHQRQTRRGTDGDEECKHKQHKSTFDRELDDVVSSNQQLMGHVVRDMAKSHFQKTQEQGTVQLGVLDEHSAVSESQKELKCSVEQLNGRGQHAPREHTIGSIAALTQQNFGGVGSISLMNGILSDMDNAESEFGSLR